MSLSTKLFELERSLGNFENGQNQGFWRDSKVNPTLLVDLKHKMGALAIRAGALESGRVLESEQVKVNQNTFKLS